jgi:hypothetical protein
MSNRNAASLTGSLLVRKGAAAPSPLKREARVLDGGAGYDAPSPGRFTPTLAPKPSPVALRAANGKPAAAAKKNGKHRPAPASARSASSGDGSSHVRRFTLRLSRDQHLRLRIASVHLGRSGQKLILEAVNEYLDRIAPELRDGNCACILDAVPAPPPTRGNKKSAR